MASVQGLNGLTIGHLAEDLKLSKGGVCAHYPSKLELQLAVVERAAQIFREAVVIPAYDQPAGLPRLQALAEAWFAYLVKGTFKGGCFFTNAVLELDDLKPDAVQTAVTNQYNGLIDLIEKNVARAIEVGEIRASVEPDQAAFDIISLLVGSMLWRGLGRQSPEKRLSVARQSVNDLWESLK